MELKNVSSVFFLGIGGIGMSALARWCHMKGVKVSGYDRTPTPLTLSLEHLGIQVSYTEAVEGKLDNIDLIVRTPAVPVEHPILAYAATHGLQVMKRSEFLGWISKSLTCLSVAGTHGKTSVTAMLTHIMKASGNEPLAFVGGILKQYDTNLLAGNGQWMIAEADEYDRSFLQLNSHAAIITAIDPDHLDIYGSKDVFHQGFVDFGKQVSSKGWIIIHDALRAFGDTVQHPKTIYYGMSDQADARVSNIRNKGFRSIFDYSFQSIELHDLELRVPGMHNILNAAAAITMAIMSGVDPLQLSPIVESFEGVKRRMDIQFVSDALLYIDDYAHHPEEITAVLNSVRTIFPGYKLRVAFQPHLFSRTRDFQIGFAHSLEIADEVILLDIYPARELPIPGITVHTIAMHMQKIVPQFASLENLPEVLLQNFTFPTVCMTLGAGSIDTCVNTIVKRMEVVA
jgi:UDP-N-acetylmuramate--alanine ligase